MRKLRATPWRSCLSTQKLSHMQCMPHDVNPDAATQDTTTLPSRVSNPPVHTMSPLESSRFLGGGGVGPVDDTSERVLTCMSHDQHRESVRRERERDKGKDEKEKHMRTSRIRTHTYPYPVPVPSSTYVRCAAQSEIPGSCNVAPSRHGARWESATPPQRRSHLRERPLKNSSCCVR